MLLHHKMVELKYENNYTLSRRTFMIRKLILYVVELHPVMIRGK